MSKKSSVSKEIADLAAEAPKVTMASLQEEINQILTRLDTLETKRGPKSSREMTADDARRVLTGDLKKMSHKEAAEELGLSYGQVYSCRGGYTFKAIHDEKSNK